MSTELRQIAERAIMAHEGMVALLGESTGGVMEDMVRVCRAYLAEHPADDEEPVGRDFVKSQERVVRDDENCVVAVLSQRDARFRIRLVWEEARPPFTHQPILNVSIQEGGSDHIYIPVAIRGHVRRLCAALGVPLKEGAPTP